MTVDNEDFRIKIHVLHCGRMLVSPRVPYGGGITLKNILHEVTDRVSGRVELPVSAYLIEHPKGRVLVDTGWGREISPDGVYDESAVKSQMPDYLAALYRPWVAKGETAVEQLAAMGLRPEDIDVVVLTHLDADHTSGLRSLMGAKRFLLPEEERWWADRTVYRLRQPAGLWEGMPIEHFWFKGTMEGPLWWSYDLFGDETVTLVCLPGHSDGHIGLRIRNGEKFIILTSDAAYTERSWREDILPGFGFNPKAIRKSYAWIRSQAQEPGCVAVIANHDPDVKPCTIEL